MKKLLIPFILLFFITSSFSAFTFPHSVRAETGSVTSDAAAPVIAGNAAAAKAEDAAKAAGANAQQITNAGNAASAVTIQGTAQNATAAPSASTAAAAASAGAAAAAKPASAGCGFLGSNLFSADCVVSVIANIAYYLMTAAGFLLGIVGNLFNWIITVTVFQYAVYFGNSAGMLAAWGILRDIGNVAILFGFIMIGMMMVLDVHSIDTRKALPRLLIFAVLMNFSLFAGEAAIDIANVLSATIYKQAGTSTFDATSSGGAQTLGSNGTSIGTNTTQIGIAGLIMQQTFAGSALAPAKLPASDGNALFTYIGITIFLLVTMVVMLAAVILFAIRAVLLTFLLVISPLGFAAMAIPQFQERGRQWQQQLLQNAFFAPTFLLLMFISVKVMEAARASLVPVGANGATLTLAAALESPSVSTGGIIIIFALMIGFMIAALKFAQSSGVAGAQFATSYAQKTVRSVAMLPLRATQGVGKALHKEVGGRVALVGAHALDAKIGAMRNAGGLQKAVAGSLIRTGIYGGVSKGLHDVAHPLEDSQKKFKELDQKAKGAALQHDKVHDLEAALGMEKGTEEQKKLRDEAIEKALQKMTQAEIEQTKIVKKNGKELEDVVRNLAPEKFDAMMGNKDLDESLKKDMVGYRFARLKGIAGSAVETKKQFNEGKDEIRKWTNEDLTALAKYDPDTFEKIVNRIDDPYTELIGDDGKPVFGNGETSISDDQYNALKNNKALSKLQRERLNSKTKGGQLIGAVTKKTDGMSTKDIEVNNRVIRDIAKNMGTGIADQPNFIFKNIEVIKTLDKSKMQNLGSKNKLSDDEKKDLLNSLKAQGTTGNPQYNDILKWLKENNRAREVWGDTLASEYPQTTSPSPAAQGASSQASRDPLTPRSRVRR